LVRSAEVRLPGVIAVTPEPTRCETEIRDPARAPIFYVSNATYERFRQEASQIYAEYCQDGRNFGAIPCSWFSQFTLTQFVSDTLWQNSYFQARMASWHESMGGDWSFEPECL
jgi:hypothetical protein